MTTRSIERSGDNLEAYQQQQEARSNVTQKNSRFAACNCYEIGMQLWLLSTIAASVAFLYFCKFNTAIIGIGAWTGGSILVMLVLCARSRCVALKQSNEPRQVKTFGEDHLLTKTQTALKQSNEPRQVQTFEEDHLLTKTQTAFLSPSRVHRRIISDVQERSPVTLQGTTPFLDVSPSLVLKPGESLVRSPLVTKSLMSRIVEAETDS